MGQDTGVAKRFRVLARQFDVDEILGLRRIIKGNEITDPNQDQKESFKA